MEFVDYSVIGNLVLGTALFFFYRAAGNWMIAFGKTSLPWNTGKKVAIEATKGKELMPYMADTPKNFPTVIKPPGRRGIVAIRRESIYHSNKTPVVMFPTEFEYTVGLDDLKGERFYRVEEGKTMFYGYVDPETNSLVEIDKLDYLAGGKYPQAGIWVKYPDHTVSPDEFVKYQEINADPLLTEHYAEHKRDELKEQIYNPLAGFINAGGLYVIAVILIAGALAYSWMGQNNQAGAAYSQLENCKNQIVTLYADGYCKGSPPLSVLNASQLPTGGGGLRTP